MAPVLRFTICLHSPGLVARSVPIANVPFFQAAVADNEAGAVGHALGVAGIPCSTNNLPPVPQAVTSVSGLPRWIAPIVFRGLDEPNTIHALKWTNGQ
jgi:hypothetical protein